MIIINKYATPNFYKFILFSNLFVILLCYILDKCSMYVCINNSDETTSGSEDTISQYSQPDPSGIHSQPVEPTMSP